MYTVDASSFARTYRSIGAGKYLKHAAVWAKQAQAAGVVVTKEGETHYQAGDYLVSNHLDGQDSYAISKEKFKTLYELDPTQTAAEWIDAYGNYFYCLKFYCLN